MTITNVYIPSDRQRAICLSDSMVAVDGAPSRNTLKFLPLPYLSGVLLFRGSQPFIWLMGSAVTSEFCIDFDHFLCRMQQYCRFAAEWHERTIGRPTGSSEPEVIAVGWSAWAAGFVAASYAFGDGFARVDQEPGLSLRPAPEGYFLPVRDVEPTTDDLIRVAEHQFRQSISEGKLGAGTGGALSMIDLDRDGAISIKVVRWLDPEAEPPAAVPPSPWWSATFAPAPPAVGDRQ